MNEKARRDLQKGTAIANTVSVRIKNHLSRPLKSSSLNSMSKFIISKIRSVGASLSSFSVPKTF